MTDSDSNQSEESADAMHQPTIPPVGRPSDGDATIPPLEVGGGPEMSEITFRNRPVVEGYQLLDELGRGGMGVVYLARNVQLDRPVALKMILGGQFASDEQVQRFLHEAESVARLDHPGIVPIYEIGQSQGNHFFAMKFIDGENLSECSHRYRSDHRAAVELMIKISEAVSHAHQRGILHRDLKPANILIDQDGKPFITDLGLAKQLDQQDGMTQTGSVMGSPGFMSPEQAAGKSDVTTGVDIYALGAVLYWLISGRPPIDGESHMDVVLRTISETPSSIMKYCPNADRNLNLICQKALKKDPAERYESAIDFCDDLKAWLDGSPLSVKPPTTVDHITYWLKRNARTVSIAAGTGVMCGMLSGGVIFLVIISRLLKALRSADSQLGDASATWVTQYFGWVETIPSGLLGALQPLIVVMTVLFGILTIFYVRPKSRELGMVAATTASLLAGIVAFSISFAWSPIIRNSLDVGRNDIRLVSEAIWLESESERDWATNSLLQKYPGLADIPVQQRGRVIAEKILRDQTLGIPRAILIGISITLCLTTLPLLFSTGFSSLIWNRGLRKFQYLGTAIEIGIYSALFFLLFNKFLNSQVGLYPGFWIQVICCGGIAVAICICLSDQKWPWRIAAFLVVNACLFVSMSESEKVRSPQRIAAVATSEVEYRRAAYYYEKQLAVYPSELSRYSLAAIYAHLGDQGNYQRQCNAMVSERKYVNQPNVDERLAKINLLKPKWSRHQSLASKLAERVSKASSTNQTSWLYLCRSLSELRQRDHQAALTWLQRTRAKVKEEGADQSIGMMILAIDALVHHQMGEQQLAKEKLLAYQDVKKTINRSRNWIDCLMAETLIEEIEL